MLKHLSLRIKLMNLGLQTNVILALVYIKFTFIHLLQVFVGKNAWLQGKPDRDTFNLGQYVVFDILKTLDSLKCTTIYIVKGIVSRDGG
jgi:hypothetical protein